MSQRGNEKVWPSMRSMSLELCTNENCQKGWMTVQNIFHIVYKNGCHILYLHRECVSILCEFRKLGKYNSGIKFDNRQLKQSKTAANINMYILFE